MKTLIQTLVLGLIAGALVYFFVSSSEEASDVPVKNYPSVLKQATDYAPIWNSLMKASIDPAVIGHQKPHDSAALLDISMLREISWEVGDDLTFKIPQTGYILETQIKEIEELALGVTSIKSYPDESMFGHILLTVSPKNTFMSLFTPDGEYELIGGQEYGWLVSSRSLDGPASDDVIVIDQVRNVVGEPMPKNPMMIRE